MSGCLGPSPQFDGDVSASAANVQDAKRYRAAPSTPCGIPQSVPPWPAPEFDGNISASAADVQDARRHVAACLQQPANRMPKGAAHAAPGVDASQAAQCSLVLKRVKARLIHDFRRV